MDFILGFTTDDFYKPEALPGPQHLQNGDGEDNIFQNVAKGKSRKSVIIEMYLLHSIGEEQLLCSAAEVRGC